MYCQGNFLHGYDVLLEFFIVPLINLLSSLHLVLDGVDAPSIVFVLLDKIFDFTIEDVEVFEQVQDVLSEIVEQG